MADKTLAKSRLAEFVDAVSQGYAVYGPRAVDGVVSFGRVSSADELALDCRVSTSSPKELFLPRTEVVYEFDGEGFVEDRAADGKRVVLGIRPCDCRALTVLDCVFDTEDVKDPFYVARRENTVLIAVGCDRPLSTCFCTAVGGGPFDEEGVDILLADSGDSFVAKAVSPKGEEFLSEYAGLFGGDGSVQWQERAARAGEGIRAGMEAAGSGPRLRELFENDVWQEVSRKCIGCGTCSCLCPICYCFDLLDEKVGKGAKKIRKWDCCMFSEFTLHASGHNPRSVGSARMRQKIMHKFTYFPERYDVIGCVGCGRCVRSCPVNLDIRQLLPEVMAAPSAAAQEAT